jgi:hypothetical protein
MSEVVHELINRCQKIGLVVGCNSGFTDFLYRRLNGRPIGRMEVDELIHEIEAARAEYKNLYARNNDGR